ncbi:MAG: helix-turn-helix transcriptional regulator [Oscillospiraceae bacterium]|nr:helix-turn-helix transcriptional regulator [Oscillospiraceae bacterium]
MYYYQRLRDIREDNDLKQEDIAQMLKMTRQQYQLYESGKREIPFHSAIELSDYFDISLDYIAGRTNNQKRLTKVALTDFENEVITKLRRLDDISKGRVMGTIDTIIEMAAQTPHKHKQ